MLPQAKVVAYLLHISKVVLLDDTAAKLPAREVWRASPSKNILLLLVFASSAGKNEQQKRNSAGLQASVASAGSKPAE
jgi:hypothetical protein